VCLKAQKLKAEDMIRGTDHFGRQEVAGVVVGPFWAATPLTTNSGWRRRPRRRSLGHQHQLQALPHIPRRRLATKVLDDRPHYETGTDPPHTPATPQTGGRQTARTVASKLMKVQTHGRPRRKPRRWASTANGVQHHTLGPRIRPGSRREHDGAQRMCARSSTIAATRTPSARTTARYRSGPAPGQAAAPQGLIMKTPAPRSLACSPGEE